MKKFIILIAISLLAVTFITACGNATTENNAQEANTSEEADDFPNALTPAQMQHDPMSFTGQISVEGTVNHNGRFNFAVFTEGETFELAIDYRGNQALPNAGTTIVVTGEMNYRPCCGPHILSTRFEVLEP